MNLVLGFVPFILFAVLMGLSPDVALWAAFAAAFTLGMRSFLDTQVLKTLDAGSTVLFGLLALYKGFVQPGLAFGSVLLAVDGGLLAVMLASLVWHEPFTLQYAREQVAPDEWGSALFLRTNYVVTGVWVAALALMTAADAAALFLPVISVTMAAVAGLIALAAALTF
ncbi:MAG TPA: hypothetical protein VGC36_10470, partial [Rhizomicrobium sp.]